MAVDPAALSGPIKLPAFRLDGKALDARVAGAVTGGSIELTIEGAPTLEITVRDSERALLRSRLFSARVQMAAVGERWELAQIRKQGDDLVLVFEPFVVAVLKRRRGARKSRRGKVTRAEFVKALVDEVKRPRLRFICPELHVKQPIERSRDRESRASKDDRRGAGIAKGADLTVKGVAATPYQIRNAERALNVAESKNAPRVAMVALIAALIVEAVLRNPTGGDRSSVGPLQLLNIHLGGSTSENGGRRDLELVSSMFLDRGFTGAGGAIALARQNPSWSPGQIAQACQGSDHPGRYDEYADEAAAIVDAYGGGGGGGGTRYRKKPYYFTRRRRESTWRASGRLAEEVGWRRFVVRDKFYFVAEADLMKSRPRMRLSEATPGVDNIDFDIDIGRDSDEASVKCRARVWQAPPGSVVLLEQCGPQANGRWLVSSIRRGLFSLDSEISLRRKRALLPEQAEPAPETVTVNRGGGGVGSDGDGMLRPVDGPITSGFGPRNGRMHQGVDIPVTVGTPIRSALSGKVEFAGEVAGYGYYMKVRHAGGLVTAYAHLSAYGASVGQQVDRGEVIAKSGGAAGAPGAGNSTGPHLHFEVIRKGVHVDPAQHL